MNIDPITSVSVKKLLDYSDGRVRVSWDERDDAEGYNVYVSYNPYNPEIKVNNSLINGEFFDIIPPDSPTLQFYVWVEAEDSQGNKTEFLEEGDTFYPIDLDPNILENYTFTETDLIDIAIQNLDERDLFKDQKEFLEGIYYVDDYIYFGKESEATLRINTTDNTFRFERLENNEWKPIGEIV